MFERFGELLTKEMQGKGYARLDGVRGPLPSERHGSWEWMFGSEAEISRYVGVSLYLGNPQRALQPLVFKVEVSVGGDDGDGFIKRVISDDLMLTESQLHWWPREMAELLGRAVVAAQRITADDLIRRYVKRPAPEDPS
jgi:hypothetical protein